MDVSVHPFTGGSHPTDVRITSRYSEDNWIEGMAGTIHECGHAMYEQGRPKDYTDLPVSEALGEYCCLILWRAVHMCDMCVLYV